MLLFFLSCDTSRNLTTQHGNYYSFSLNTQIIQYFTKLTQRNFGLLTATILSLCFEGLNR
jgi:hypothetical protein